MIQAVRTDRWPYSEVFEGRFDGAKLAGYLNSIATAKENYAEHDIFTIPVASDTIITSSGKKVEVTLRSLRVSQLGYDTIATSNMPTAEQIHSILDRYRAAASPFSGSSLLSARYRDVPLLSTAWAIGHVGLPFSDNGKNNCVWSAVADARGYDLRRELALYVRAKDEDR